MQDKLYFLGDIHGQFESISQKIKKQDIKDASIVQVGDFGVGFLHTRKEESKLTVLNDALKARNINLYAIRGNHDSPIYFHLRNNPYNLSNITLLPDYSEINLAGKNIFLVGGATSVDRVFRKEGLSWWRGEKLIFNNKFTYNQYDVVVTHSRPIESGLFLGFKNIEAFLQIDPALKKDLERENKLLSKLYEKVKYAPNWFFGHFHEKAESHFNNTKFKALTIDELYRLS